MKICAKFQMSHVSVFTFGSMPSEFSSNYTTHYVQESWQFIVCQTDHGNIKVTVQKGHTNFYNSEILD